MKVRLSFRSRRSKVITVIALITLGFGGFAIWKFVISSEEASAPAVQSVSNEISTDNIFTYLTTDASLASFSEYLGAVGPLQEKSDASFPPAADGSTVPYKTLILAPTNAAFNTEDGQKLGAVPPAVSAELKEYYIALFGPSADGSEKVVELTDGMRLTMLNGREVFIKKTGSKVIVTDAKGREARVQGEYVVDNSGNKIYFIDSVLLLQ